MLYATYLHTTAIHAPIIQVFESEEIAAAFCFLYNERNHTIDYYYRELYITRDLDTWGVVAQEGEIQAILASTRHTMPESWAQYIEAIFYLRCCRDMLSSPLPLL